MNTRVYLLVLSITLIAEGSPLPCSCKSGLNSPLESTACSCSKNVVIPAQFIAINSPSYNYQSGSQPKPQPCIQQPTQCNSQPCIQQPTQCISQQPQQSPQQPQQCIGSKCVQSVPCIPRPMPPQTVRPPLQPCVPTNQVQYISAGSSSCSQPCVPSGSSSGSQPCVPSGSSSGSQPCVQSGSSSGSQPCVPIPFFDEESLFKRPSACNCAKTIQAPDQRGDFYFKPKRQKPIPVDPVSLALAYQQTLRSNVKEDQLAYGFQQQPIEQRRGKKIPNIPEEKLFDIKAKVIEFRKPKYSEESSSGEQDDDEDDDEDDEIDDKDQSDENVFVRRKPKKCQKDLSYGHLGYHEVRSKSGKFVDKKPEPKPPKTKPCSSSMGFGAVMKVYEPDIYSLPKHQCNCHEHTLFTR